MKSIIFISILFCFFFGCKSSSNSITNRSTECQQYYLFISKNWLQKEDPYVFQFKGEPLNWWSLKEYGNYCKEKCMLGLTREQIIHLFGEPSKSLKVRGIETISYCLTDNCLKKSSKHIPQYLGIAFDSLQKVNQFILMPPPIKTIEDEE